jgi:hypothetical protein
MANLSTYYPAPITAADLGLGAGSNATFGSIQNTPIGNTTPAAGTFTTLTANNGTITASAPVLDLAQTWNASGTTFTGFRLNVTNTASAVTSLLADIQLGGTTLLGVNRDGVIGRFNTSTGATRSGIFFNGQGANRVSIVAGDDIVFYLAPNDIGIAGTAQIRWDSTGGSPTGTGTGLALLRDGANHILAQRVGTNPQTFNIYNTFTSATNHERGFLRWSSNVFQIGTEKGSGGGTARNLEFQTDGTTRLTIDQNSLRTGTTKLILGSATNIEWGAGTIGIQASTSASPAYFKVFTASTDRLIIDPNGLLCLGGTTTSFPALKRSSTVLQARLANDSDFCPLQGQLRIHQNAVSETITATHTLTLFDAAGTAYKVPCVAA